MQAQVIVVEQVALARLPSCRPQCRLVADHCRVRVPADWVEAPLLFPLHRVSKEQEPSAVEVLEIVGQDLGALLTPVS